jgi:O-antigen chain-terminating methyltransferase
MNINTDSVQAHSPDDQDFYLAFENKYRGSTESIQLRQSAYLPYVQSLKASYPNLKALDLGCGRGEWLMLLKKEGINASGVDLDEAMLASCRQHQLNVNQEDALGALKGLPDDSLQMITGFHIVEHLPFNQVITLCKEAYRVLSPGGLLILETPNSENIHVASSTFYLDPTHSSPLPSKLLTFLMEFVGFSKSVQIGLNPDVSVDASNHVSLQNVLLSGVSRDYAVIGQKAGNSDAMRMLLDDAHVNNISSLESMVDRFDMQLAQAYALLQDQQRRVTRLEAPLRFLKKLFAPFFKK